MHFSSILSINNYCLPIVGNYDGDRRVELTDGLNQSYQAWIADKRFNDDSHQLINFPLYFDVDGLEQK